MTTTRIDISICPTSLEFTCGDRYDESLLINAIEEYAKKKFPGGVTLACLQVGHRQGDEWAKINGDRDAGELFLQDFFDEHGSDEDLFVDNNEEEETT